MRCLDRSTTVARNASPQPGSGVARRYRRRRRRRSRLTDDPLARPHLGVKPMALYHHVANKDEILDGIVDLVFDEIELPSLDGDWQSEMVRRANSPVGH